MYDIYDIKVLNNKCKMGGGVVWYELLFHFKYFIDKSIGLDNRLCLYKSSPTTRWNN
jgi:hypothetical protein